MVVLRGRVERDIEERLRAQKSRHRGHRLLDRVEARRCSADPAGEAILVLGDALLERLLLAVFDRPVLVQVRVHLVGEFVELTADVLVQSMADVLHPQRLEGAGRRDVAAQPGTQRVHALGDRPQAVQAAAGVEGVQPGEPVAQLLGRSVAGEYAERRLEFLEGEVGHGRPTLASLAAGLKPRGAAAPGAPGSVVRRRRPS